MGSALLPTIGGMNAKMAAVGGRFTFTSAPERAQAAGGRTGMWRGSTDAMVLLRHVRGRDDARGSTAESRGNEPKGTALLDRAGGKPEYKVPRCRAELTGVRRTANPHGAADYRSPEAFSEGRRTDDAATLALRPDRQDLESTLVLSSTMLRVSGGRFGRTMCTDDEGSQSVGVKPSFSSLSQPHGPPESTSRGGSDKEKGRSGAPAIRRTRHLVTPSI
ncbi:hypothetical protein THAOC_16803 [Thalassiosira oceanica]|uniref:Uncharacterized protein n=1 Tax=Thalassiosira oceanica TaxID=159749 RepID=K0S8U9_THAOC|nr:hypothetical protein THAOC_16803 [Thalassiosira oceanica]|eukprot:EJK62583.1 hypothetical protein THAOC_16803 [Thalassiosira oceanica]